MQVDVDSFVPQRLAVARDFRGLTQQVLADRVGVSHEMISYLENGKREPTRTLTDALGQALGFDPQFFHQPLADPFYEKECNFRHRRSAPERLKTRIRAHGTLIGVVVHYLRTVLKLPPYTVPQLKATSQNEIETAAEQCREHWHLGIEAPVNSMTRVLENAGVVVVKHVAGTERIDALSRRGPVNIVFLDALRQPPSRLVFDMAHELGHLVLHAGIMTGSKETEQEADRFGSAFLMPRGAFGREFRASPLSWPHIFELKRRWRASAAAVITRAHTLSLIGADDYRRLFKYMTVKQWRKVEPMEPDPPQPELLKVAVDAAAGIVGSFQGVCRAVHMTPATFYDVTGVTLDQPLERGLRLVSTN